MLSKRPIWAISNIARKIAVHLHVLVLILCALYGSVFTIGKLALEFAPPLFITGGRMILASLLLLIYQICFQRKSFSIQKKYILPIVIVGFSNVYLCNALEFWGLQFMESGKACFLYSFAPIATAFLSYFWFSEKITGQKWLGLILGILGFLPILMVHASSVEDTSGSFGFLSFAELAILGSAVATAIGWMAMRVVMKDHSASPILANAYSMLLGGLLALLHSFAVEDWNPTPISDFWPFLQWFLLLTLVSNLLAYNLNAYLLRFYTATYINFAGLSQSFFAAFFGWIFLHEVMSVYFWISVTAVSIGLFIYYREELKQGYIPVNFKTKSKRSTKTKITQALE